jgi:hypothetical protein
MIEFDRPWKDEEDDVDGGFEGSFESLVTITHPYDICVSDLAKRASAMVCVLNTPKANKKYNRNQAINLMNKCTRVGRRDLTEMIQEALL